MPIRRHLRRSPIDYERVPCHDDRYVQGMRTYQIWRTLHVNSAVRRMKKFKDIIVDMTSSAVKYVAKKGLVCCIVLISCSLIDSVWNEL